MQTVNNNKPRCSDPSLNLKNLSSSQLLTETYFKAMPLFPTMGSRKELFDLAESSLPITNKNDLTALLATFQNTLLAQMPVKP